MTYAQFQEHFEQRAEAERARFAQLPVSKLLSMARTGNFGDCYQIWYSIAEKAKPEEVNDFLLMFLSSQEEYLHRYHCAAALIAVNNLGPEGWEPQHLSAERTNPVGENLKKIHARLLGAHKP